MKRLTEKSKNGRWKLAGVPWAALGEGKTITKDIQEKLYGALCKLKDYEDTELSPDDDGDGTYYLGDEEENCISQDLYVNAWMPLPEPYRLGD